MVSNGTIKKILTIIATLTISTILINLNATEAKAQSAPFIADFISLDELPSTEMKLTIRGKTCKYKIYSHILYALKKNCKAAKEEIERVNSQRAPHHQKEKCEIRPVNLKLGTRGYGTLPEDCVRYCEGIAHFEKEWTEMKSIKTKNGYELKFPREVPSFFLRGYGKFYSPYGTYVDPDWYKRKIIENANEYNYGSFNGYRAHLTDPENCEEGCAEMKSIKRTIWNNKDIWETLRKIIGEKLKINTEKTSFKKLHRNWTPDKAECGKVNILGKEYNDCMAAGLLKVMKYPIIIKLLMMTFKKI